MMEMKCHCHGLSGSCSVQYCRYSLPNFRMVGNVLKEIYDNAQEAHFEQSVDNDGNATIALSKSNDPTKMIYVDRSISYCERRDDLDVLGTRGRRCEPRAEANDSCEKMCCNRGYNNLRETVSMKCKCTFVWCCSVQCEKCFQDIRTSICK